MPRAALFLLLALPTLAAAQAAPRLDRFGDPLPPGAIARLGTVRLRHGAAIYQLEFFPDGKTLASRGHDGTLRLWDVATGKQLRALPKEGKAVGCFALSPDGKTLAAADRGEGPRVIRLWETATGREVATLDGGSGLEVWRLAFSPDGRLLACGGEQGRPLCIWNLATKKQLGAYDAGGLITGLAFSDNSRQLATLSQGTVSLRDLKGGQARPLEQGSAQIEQIAPVPKTSELVTVDSNGVVRFWDFTTGKQSRPDVIYADTPPRWAYSGAFSANARWLVINPESRHLAVWDLEGGRRLQSFGRRGRGIPVLALSPDGSTLASEEGGAIRLWDVRTGKERLPLTGHRAPIEQLVYLNGRTLASVGLEEATFLWDIPSGKQLANRPAGFLAQDGGAVARVDWETMVRLEDVATRKLTCLFQGHRNRVRKVAFSPCGRKMASLDDGGVFHLWERGTGKPLRRLLPPEELAASPNTVWRELCFAANGKTLLAWGTTARQIPPISFFALWDTATGKLLQSSANDGYWVISPDSEVLAEVEPEAGSGQALVLKHAQTGRQLRRLPWEEPPWNRGGYGLEALVFSPDGRLVTALAGPEGKLRLFEVSTGKLVHSLKGCDRAIFLAGFSRDGRNLVTLGSNQSLQVWEVAGGKERARFRVPHGVHCLGFSPDGRTLATGGNDTTVLVWDLTGLPAEKQKLSPQELQAAWGDLGSTDAARAYRAMWRLVDAAEQSVPLLRRRLHLSPGPDPRRLQELLRELDSDEYEAREKAHRQLQRLGVLAEDALRKELASDPAVEVRQRIRRLLAGMSRYPITAEQLRQLRVLEMLEYAGSAEARQMLRRLADEMAAPLRQEARAALERLTRPSLPCPVPAQPLARQ